MEKEKNIMTMVIQHLKDIFYITIEEMVLDIDMGKQNIKENIYMMKNGVAKDLMEKK